LFQISGRLFADSGPRRSSRLSSDASLNANAAVVSGNGTGNSSKYLGGSKLSSMSFRSMAVRKGQPWPNENADEGEDESLLYHITFSTVLCFFYVFLCKDDCFEAAVVILS